jgi:DNA-binding SARP family transcriptional activator
MTQLSLTLLGGFRARLEPGGPLMLPTRKAQALLAYLALPLGRAHPRDKLAALLWGGIREESARASLRQALFTVRRALAPTEPPALQVEGESIAMNPAAVDTDVGAFERAVAEGTPAQLERAAALYEGDLLAGLAVDEPPLEEWLLSERERLRELALRGLARLLAHQQQVGAGEAAIQTGLRLLGLDPLQEPVHRTLMRLYAELGRRGAGLRQYQLCVSVLHRELGVEPDAETKALYQDILRQHPGRAAVEPPRAAGPGHAGLPRQVASVVETPLIGRATELGRLGEALEQGWTGSGRFVAVVGEVGIGKTRLVTELAVGAEQRGGRVLVGRCYESERALPFGPWVDAFRAGQAIADLEGVAPAWRAELARLLPELAGPGAREPTDPADYLQLFEGVAQAIRHLASRRPLLLVLEDLQWADEISLRLLAFLGRRLQTCRALGVVTAREEELADAPALRRALEDLERGGHLAVHPLGPLAIAETMALVRALVRTGSEGGALAILGELAWTASEGNPFVAVETVRAHAQGAAPASGRSLALPQRVRELVTRRFDRLSERARTLTAVAAVVGREFDFAVLQRAARLGEVEAAEAVEELVRRRVLHGVGERFDFTHDRIREVAYAELLSPRRKLLHRQVAEAFEAVYAGNLEPHHGILGTHYREGEVWNKAALYLEKAGTAALLQTAHREATVLFEQALAALDHLPESRERTERALDLMGSLRNALYPIGALHRTVAIGRTGEVLARRIGDKRRLARFLAGNAHDMGSLGDLAGAIVATEEASAIADAIGDAQLKAGLNGARPFYGVGDYHRASEFARAVIAAFQGDRLYDRVEGGLLPAVQGRVWLTLCLAELGEFGEGVKAAAEAIRIAGITQNAHDRAWAYLGAGRFYLVRGDLTPAIHALECGLPLTRGSDLMIYFPRVAASLGMAYALAGRVMEGLALLEEAAAVGGSIGFVFGQSLVLASLAEGHLLAGQLDEAMRVAGEALELARKYSHSGWEAWILRAYGEIAVRGDSPEDAQAFFRQAMTLAEEHGMQPLRAHCHLGLGCVAAQWGRPGEGRAEVDIALGLYRTLGMPFWITRAERERARLGSSGPSRE